MQDEAGVVNGAPMTAVLSHDGDQVCIYVEEYADSNVAAGDEMTATNVTTEQLLLVTKILTTGLSDTFAERYDMMDLVVVSGGEAGNGPDAAMDTSWVWVARPYWALMQAWIFSAFTFGKAHLLFCCLDNSSMLAITHDMTYLG